MYESACEGESNVARGRESLRALAKCGIRERGRVGERESARASLMWHRRSIPEALVEIGIRKGEGGRKGVRQGLRLMIGQVYPRRWRRLASCSS